MAKLIRDEDEILALVLANPEHPKAKKYLQDFQNGLLESVALQIEICDALNFHYVQEAKTAEREKESRELRDERLVQKLLLMRQNEQRLALPKQQEYLERTIKELDAEISSLQQTIKSANAEIDKIDDGWKARQAKIQNDFVAAIKDIPLVDINGNPLLHSEFEARLSAAPNTQSVKEIVTQPDLKKHLLELISDTLSLDPMQLNQMARKDNVNYHIKMLRCFAGEDVTPQQMVSLVNQYKQIGEILQDLLNPTVSPKAEDIGKTLTALKVIAESEKTLKAKNEAREDSHNKLSQFEKLRKSISEQETETPVKRR